MSVSVEFHFNVPDRLHYTARLLRKAHSMGLRSAVVGDAGLLQRLSEQLWTVGPLDFISHCTDEADASMQTQSSILMGQGTGAMQGRTVLVNLGEDVPNNFDSFSRLIEIVDADPQHRQMARNRWRTYLALGHTLVQHDFQKKENT